jgi:hypothetical protein
MTRFRSPWHRIRRPRPHDWRRHQDRLTGEQLPEATYVPRGLR